MAVSRLAFLVLLAAVGSLRLIELRVSARNQARLQSDGAQRVADPRYVWMVALHAGVLVGAAAEVVFLDRPFVPALAVGMAIVLVATNAVRWWVMLTLRGRWSVNVMTPSRRGLVATGPFRFVRHPNYAAVFVEMIALPLVHTAWTTAVVGVVAHVWLLRGRIALEESVLFADAGYRAEMAAKPRFVPRLF
jgi:methyltransferase